ncbi:unnamed protein product, partial [Effrenium voratum]
MPSFGGGQSDDGARGHGYAGGFSESGFDSSIPVWDGKAESLRDFRKLVSWWVSSIDLTKTVNFNLAARFAMKQKGSARLRALEFEPADLEYRPAETQQDPETEEELVLVEADYTRGIYKILDAWEEMVGRTLTDRRGELRERFYLHLRRPAHESVSNFALRYRTLLAELKSEGVVVDDAEAAWFYKNKLGLSGIQKQLLETTLGTNADVYADCERESFGGHHSTNVAENADEEWYGNYEETEAEVVVVAGAEDCGGHPGEAGEAIEAREVLQSEVEVLASELEEAAADESLDEQTLAELEGQLEQAVEALVTMREAKTRLAAVRKDRGFKGAGRGTGKGPDKKNSQCRACYQHGRWAGDSECAKGGKSKDGKGKKGAGRLTKALNFKGQPDVKVMMSSVENISEVMMAERLSEVLDFLEAMGALVNFVSNRMTLQLLPDKPVLRLGQMKAGRWARFTLRLVKRSLWHWQGVLLWLLQRPALRFLPTPYPSTTMVSEWQQQAEDMVLRGSWPRRWVTLAAPKFNGVMLNAAIFLRSRMGMVLSFMEDEMVQEMMVAEMQKLRESGEDKVAAQIRRLKSELIQLATLLHIKVEGNDKIDTLKSKIIPVVQTLKGEVVKKPECKNSSSGSGGGDRSKVEAAVNIPEQVPRPILDQRRVEFQHDQPQALAKAVTAMIAPQLQAASSSPATTVESPENPDWSLLAPRYFNMAQDGVDAETMGVQSALRRQRQLHVDKEVLDTALESQHTDVLKAKGGMAVEDMGVKLGETEWIMAKIYGTKVETIYFDVVFIGNLNENYIDLTIYYRRRKRTWDLWRQAAADLEECEPWYGVTQFVPLEKRENSVWEAVRQKPLISEIFTDTEPVVRAAQRRGHATGTTMTLGSGYDFHKHADRQRCLETIRKEKPFMLVIAFPCGPWSPLKRLLLETLCGGWFYVVNGGEQSSWWTLRWNWLWSRNVEVITTSWKIRISRQRGIWLDLFGNYENEVLFR